MRANNEMRRCEKCIWFDQCGDRGLCDGYESELSEEIMDESAYRADLRVRAEAYDEQVAEQDE